VKYDAKCGNTDGKAFVFYAGGVAPYTFEWKDATGAILATNNDSIYNLPVGLYKLLIKDSKTCKDSIAFEIGTTDAPTVTTDVITPANCTAANGAATITATGGVAPYTYLWTGPSGPKTTEDVTGLLAGTYNVQVTDANGCVENKTVIILNAPSSIVIALAPTAPTCGNANGAINATITGGTAPLTFAWTGPGGPYTTEDLTALASGHYKLTVTDASGCTNVEEIDLNNSNGPVIADVIKVEPLCAATASGSITGGDLTVTILVLIQPFASSTNTV
jgi:hypothetical protein